MAPPLMRREAPLSAIWPARLRRRGLLPALMLPSSLSSSLIALKQAGRSLRDHDKGAKLTPDHGVLVIPDFIANAGAVICAAMEYRGGTQRAAFDYIDDRVRTNTRAVLEESRREKKLPRAAALVLAERRVRSAMQLGRWH